MPAASRSRSSSSLKPLHLEPRQTGDGESESETHTPPSEEAFVSTLPSTDHQDYSSSESPVDLTEFSFKLDLIGILLFVAAASTRFLNLTFPPNIVFDELHYGKYASLYLRRIFFFDPHPPLGKQLIAASAALFDPNYNGTFKFDKIGTPYPESVPVFGLRFIPALTGSLLPPVAYLLCRELGISHRFAFLAGILLIFDNALLIQSRYILMEMPMILFGMLSIAFAVKFTKQSHPSRSLLLAGASSFFGTLSLSVKYVGALYAGISGSIIIWHLWTKVVPRTDYSTSRVLKIMSAVYIVFSAVSIATYVGIFYIHLSVLTNAGPHDSVMTSAFQASLKGGLASIIKGQPVEVAHGSQITLRHALGRACWLHSHLHNYPIKYSDGRGSSHQQQVTCYSFKDVNNWWIVKRPNVDNLGVNETKDIIKTGDEIHLVHGMSGRLLNSHDVAAPQSPQNQEVSCYVDHNVSMAAEPLWRVEVVGGCEETPENCRWEAVRSTVRLIHATTGQALRMSGKQLPKWGFNQHEVVTDRIVAQDDTVWNVEEHRYTKSEKDREKELLEAEMIPTQPTTLSFWAKFVELQWKMLVSGSGTQAETHAYSSSPTEWPLLHRGIAYWIGTGSNAQIHLLGNPFLWFAGSLFLLLNAFIIVTHLILKRRGIHWIAESEWETLTFQSTLCVGGYLITYIYHFCLDRTLFLHHYLPSYVFKILLLITTLNHLHRYSEWKLLRSILHLCIMTWVIGVVWSFSRLSPLSYGEPSLSRTELESLRWRSNWDFIIQANH